MPYLGNTAGNRFVASKAATQFSGDGSTTAFTLDHAVGSDEDILVSVDGVIQEPSVAYAVSNGTTLTFTAAPSSNSGNNIFVYYLFRTVGTVSHPSNNALQASDITVDTTTLVTDSTNNRVGIGTSAPDKLLHLNATGGDSIIRMTRSNSASTDDNFGSIEFENSAGTVLAGIKGISLSGNTEAGLIFGAGGGNTERMRIDNSGTVTMPNQPAFLARKNSNLSNFAHGSNVTVDYNDEIFDQNADYNNSSYTFTAPVTGKYHLNARVRFTNLDTGAGYYYLGIITSNREYYNIVPTQFASDVSYYTAIVSELVDMDASDTAYCVVYQEASGTSGQTDIQGGSTFGGFLAC